MANTIELSKSFVPLLDEVYKNSCLTSVLDGDSELAKLSASSGEMMVPLLDMQGLGNYSRTDGYAKGDVTLTYQSIKCNFDRGRMFIVDTMDNSETAGIAFGRLAGEFIRTKVAPELDAFRFSTYSSGAKNTTTTATFSDGKSVISELRKGSTLMDKNEVPNTDRYLFISPTLLGMIEDLDSTASKTVLESFAGVAKVPESRFFSKIIQKDGVSDNQKDGGFTKDSTAKNINFLIIHKNAVIQFDKHIAPKIISPELNPDSDAWKYGYRNVGIANIYKNKIDGIYANFLN